METVSAIETFKESNVPNKWPSIKEVAAQIPKGERVLEKTLLSIEISKKSINKERVIEWIMEAYREGFRDGLRKRRSMYD